MKILVTGGAGFIGSHLVDSLLSRGNEVIVIDNLVTGSSNNLTQQERNPNFRFFNIDICDTDSLNEIFTSVCPDAVFHLAAQINVRHSIQDPLYCSRVNIIGTVNILEAMRATECGRIIFASTGGVMFSTDKPPYQETDIPSPNTPYGISKHCAEELIDFYSRQYAMQSTILRYANVYGSRQDPRGEAGIIAIFLEHIRQKTIPTIFGDGLQTRDFIHVSDVVAANLHVLERAISGTYHVGTSLQTSINELWNIFGKQFHLNMSLNYGPAIAEPRFVSLSIDKLVSTGWAPLYDLEKGIKELAES